MTNALFDESKDRADSFRLSVRLRYRLVYGWTGVFLWPGFSGVLVLAILSGIAGGSTSRQPRGLVSGHGRLTRVDPALWDVLRWFENAWPIFAGMLLLALGIFVLESARGKTTATSGVTRLLAVASFWIWAGLSVFVLLAPIVYVLLARR